MSEATCIICGEPMPPGEEMFHYHGFSGPCPKPPLPKSFPMPPFRETETAAKTMIDEIERLNIELARLRAVNADLLETCGNVADVLGECIERPYLPIEVRGAIYGAIQALRGKRIEHADMLGKPSTSGGVGAPSGEPHPECAGAGGGGGVSCNGFPMKWPEMTHHLGSYSHLSGSELNDGADATTVNWSERKPPQHPADAGDEMEARERPARFGEE